MIDKPLTRAQRIKLINLSNGYGTSISISNPTMKNLRGRGLVETHFPEGVRGGVRWRLTTVGQALAPTLSKA